MNLQELRERRRRRLGKGRDKEPGYEDKELCVALSCLKENIEKLEEQKDFSGVDSRRLIRSFMSYSDTPDSIQLAFRSMMETITKSLSDYERKIRRSKPEIADEAVKFQKELEKVSDKIEV